MKDAGFQTKDVGLSDTHELTRTGERLHAMDIIRGSMMSLGIVIHASCTYMVTPFPVWPVHDKESALVFDFIVMFVHCFRMPLFFAVSGFFTAQLVSRRGVRNMIVNRIRRVALPFLITLPFIYAAVVMAITLFKLIEAGNPDAIQIALQSVLSPTTWAGLMTVHLWFLYYLFIICLLAALLHFSAGMMRSAASNHSFASVLVASCASVLNKLSSVSIGSKVAPILWSFLSFLLLLTTHETAIPTDFAFLINLKVFAIYNVFFLFGWLLYAQQHLLEHFRQMAFMRIVLGCFILILKFVILTLGISSQPTVTILLTMIDATGCWFLIFGIIGAGLRYWNGYSAAARYLSDASYWFYLIHVPIILTIQAFLFNVEAPAVIEFIITILLTSIICLISYNYLVRNTFIGLFLNGKKYPRGLPADNNYPARA